MLGRSHFVSGVIATEVAGLSAHFSLTQMITGLVLGPCAALLPDIDHQKATISKTYGPITVGFSRILSKTMGGHRAGTHSIFGILLLGGVTQACVTYRHNPVSMVVLSAILIVTLAAGVRVLRIKGWVDDLAPIPVVIGVVCLTPLDLHAVPVALMLGCTTHVLGDCLTNSGCPVFWPFGSERLKFGLFATGKKVEKRIVFPAMLTAMFGLAVYGVYAAALHSM